jgi:hypothetical protein
VRRCGVSLRPLVGVAFVMACQRAQAPEPPPPAPVSPPTPVPAVAPRPPPVDAAVVAAADAAAPDAKLPHGGDTDYPTPSCPPSALAALEQCIIDQGFSWHVDEVNANAAGDLRLLYVHEDVYIAAALAGSWRIVDLLKHVQDHGHRHSDLTVEGIHDTQQAGVRVTRIDYHFTADTVNDNDRDEHGDSKVEHDDRHETASCTWKPNAIECDTHPW